MTDSITFGRAYSTNIKQLINQLDILRTQDDMMVQDPTLSQAAADAMASSGRPDLTKTVFDNAHAALVQILFAYDSGTPPQKSLLYKML